MAPADRRGALERHFDPVFTNGLALREKQIQQAYRPVIGVHKWFARRAGTVFRSLLLAEFVPQEPTCDAFWHAHGLRGVIADPFMGGGTPLYEANRLGFDVVGCDVNPMAAWVVRQSLQPLDEDAFVAEAARVVADVEAEVGELYQTRCVCCEQSAPVKYFLWVKQGACSACGADNDLFPGHRLAEARRHPRHVLVCAGCGELNEYDTPPTNSAPANCAHCDGQVTMEGNARKKRATCRACSAEFSYPSADAGPPEHRLWAIEYRCQDCYPGHAGRMFKAPDLADRERVARAGALLRKHADQLPLPNAPIPSGDETNRLHRWGYRNYLEMFGERQQLGLGILLRRITRVQRQGVRHALLTVFSDFLRYQNMLCRYDTYALKCQDIFSVHGFPVGLVQCENNLLGIPRVGSGAFRHFVEKFVRAKQYCAAPFETRRDEAGKKEVVPVEGETIAAEMVQSFPQLAKKRTKRAWLLNGPSQDAVLPAGSLDGVFTDPPYFDNVQYAELMDFCFVWLRQALGQSNAGFLADSTRSDAELTGNVTLGRGLEHFASGLARVFTHYGQALKPGAPFVFTYHHNDAAAYLPIVIAILDAPLRCTATLPVAGEMNASLHIAGTASSVLDSVFVCRSTLAKKPSLSATQLANGQQSLPLTVAGDCAAALAADCVAMAAAGVTVSVGDRRCLLAGHLARIMTELLAPGWDASAPIADKMRDARQMLGQLLQLVDVEALVAAEVAAAMGTGNQPPSFMPPSLPPLPL